MNFSTNITKIGDDVSSKWTTMINAVANKEYDLLLSGNSQTGSRAKLVDFSFAIIPTSLRIIFMKGRDSANWLVYFNAFLTDSWQAMPGLILATLFLYVGLQYLAYKVNKYIFQYKSVLSITSILIGRC